MSFRIRLLAWLSLRLATLPREAACSANWESSTAAPSYREANSPHDLREPVFAVASVLCSSSSSCPNQRGECGPRDDWRETF